MRNNVTLLHLDDDGTVERNLTKIVEYMGGTVQAVMPGGDAGRQVEVLRNMVPVGGCVIASARILGAPLRTILRELKARVLVYGLDSTPKSAELLKALTAGFVTGVEQPDLGGQISVADCRDVCGQMSNRMFDADGACVRIVFKTGVSRGDCTPLLSIGQSPFFVAVKDHGCHWMLLAGDQAADLDAPVAKGTSVLKFFPGLAPIMMFLRAAAPEAFWHSDAPTACFIVDDPLLTRRYGFLDYQKLIEVMDQRRFSTSIAFIPWNYLRSKRRVTKMFASRPAICSLSVHGCDHTRAEFGSTDPLVLREKAQLALYRLTKHSELTGLTFDEVMVFPQGIFSTAAMAALKLCGYLAAVNSTPYPIDGEQSLALRDLLAPAVTKFSNFPLFTRRYPHHLPELAFDLFLGKPALLVEHHGFFRDGYDALADTVEKLKSMEPQLQWANPAAICSRCCWKRIAKNGDIHVLFFTNRFDLRNETSQPQQYVLFRQGLPEKGSTAFTINGHRGDSWRIGNGIQARISLDAGEFADIRIENGELELVASANRAHPMYQVGVFIRRRLSEFRDNYLDRSPFLGNSAINVRQRSAKKRPVAQALAG